MSIPWGEVGAGAVAGIALAWRIYDGLKERKLSKEYGIKNNPDRCREHDLAIVGIQKDIESLKEDISEIKMKINAPFPHE